MSAGLCAYLSLGQERIHFRVRVVDGRIQFLLVVDWGSHLLANLLEPTLSSQRLLTGLCHVGFPNTTMSHRGWLYSWVLKDE